MVSKTKKASTTSNKKTTKKVSSKKEDMVVKLMPKLFKLMDKESKNWEKKGKGFLSYKIADFYLKELGKDSYMKFKRCSQQHCKEQFDKFIEKVNTNIEKDTKVLIEHSKKILAQVLKDNGQKPDTSMYLMEDEKLKRKIFKEAEKKMKPYLVENDKKYKQFTTEIIKCAKMHCKHERETLHKSLKNKMSKMSKNKKISDMAKLI